MTSQYDCGDGVCVHKSLVCNGRINCNKSRDEANCTLNNADSRQSHLLSLLLYVEASLNAASAYIVIVRNRFFVNNSRNPERI